jgi:hypothetical protein
MDELLLRAARADRTINSVSERLERLVVEWMERSNRLALRNLELQRDLDEALVAYDMCVNTTFAVLRP